MSANVVPFGNAVECDVCKGSGCSERDDQGFAGSCPMCHGLGEIRPQPKAITGPENHALNHERPQFDWSRFLGAMDIFCENVREAESQGYAITENLQDADLNDLANDMLSALNQAGERARQLLRRAESLRSR